MAWTTPRTWVASEVPTAAVFNTHVRDNLNALYGTTTTWTPQVDQGASTNIAKTVGEARYVQMGRVLFFWFDLTMTAAGTAGSAITVTVPVTASGHSAGAVVGSGWVGRTSGGTADPVAVQFASALTKVQFVGSNTTSAAEGANPNFALASGSILRASGFYIVA